MNYYDKIAKGYDGLHQKEQQAKLEIIKRFLSIGKNSKMLDVGCGTGISSDFGCFVAGIDPSIGLLRQNRNSKKILAFAEHIPFKAKAFDCIISVTSMHNFSDIGKSISEIKRVGKDNFVFSILKRSRNYARIKEIIQENFFVHKEIEEQFDTIFFCQKTA